MLLSLDGDLALIVRQLRREQLRATRPAASPSRAAFKRVLNAWTSGPGLAPQPDDRVVPPLREYPYP